MIDVVVAVEDPLVRLGIKTALDDTEDCRAVAVLEGPEHMWEALDRHHPQVLILDVCFRRADETLLPILAERYSGCSVLVYVEHSSEHCALRHLPALGNEAHLSDDAVRMLDECCLTSLKDGVRGCLPHEVEPDSLLRAVRAVAAGEIAAAPWLTAVVRMGVSDRDPERAPRAITPRELEVIALVAKGFGNKQIGRRLGIREQTVKNHVTRAMEKLGLNSRLEIGLLAVRMNLELTGDSRS
jgi:DNA-binding NarL/FixJ family response regulator